MVDDDLTGADSSSDAGNTRIGAEVSVDGIVDNLQSANSTSPNNDSIAVIMQRDFEFFTTLIPRATSRLIYDRA